MPDVIVIGGGLAGLACALHLEESGVDVSVLEASDAPGGRVRTDAVDGFLLDRGFQVLLTGYPELARFLDLDALALRPFETGSMVWDGSRLHTVADPLRHPDRVLATLRAPAGSMTDKMRIARLRFRLGRASEEALLSGDDVTTAEWLDAQGFSAPAIEGLLRPLFSGIQLDDRLQSSSRVFRFVFGMLARAPAVVPAAGMQAIPDQMAARLSPDVVRLDTEVAELAEGGVVLTDGSKVEGAAVVVATEAPVAARLIGIDAPESLPASCVYFSAERPPYHEPVVVLDGTGKGPVNNLAVMTNVTRSYAPEGRALIAAQVLGVAPQGVEAGVRRQLSDWFGEAVAGWRHLHTYRIRHAQPAQWPPFEPVRPARIGPRRYVAGDHRATACINGALQSGRLAAAAVLADL